MSLAREPHLEMAGTAEALPLGLRLPDFLIVGAMRSGTTALARYLGRHPEVFMAPEKETHFFDRHFDEGLEWYSRRFARAGSASAVGEATQSYMYDPVAVERMRAVVPEAKFTAILRNPIDRAYSHYWLNRARGLEELPFSEAVRAEPERLAAGRRERFVYSYIDRGRYLGQLQNLRRHYPRSALHVVLFEDMRADPKRVFEEVCRHIGVDPSFEPADLGRQINAHVTFRSPSLRRFGKRLPRRLARGIGRLNVRRGDYPAIPDGDRDELREVFSQDVQDLAAWLDRDLSAWMH